MPDAHTMNRRIFISTVVGTVAVLVGRKQPPRRVLVHSCEVRLEDGRWHRVTWYEDKMWVDGVMVSDERRRQLLRHVDAADNYLLWD